MIFSIKPVHTWFNKLTVYFVIVFVCLHFFPVRIEFFFFVSSFFFGSASSCVAFLFALLLALIVFERKCINNWRWRRGGHVKRTMHKFIMIFFFIGFVRCSLCYFFGSNPINWDSSDVGNVAKRHSSCFCRCRYARIQMKSTIENENPSTDSTSTSIFLLNGFFFVSFYFIISRARAFRDKNWFRCCCCCFVRFGFN